MDHSGRQYDSISTVQLSPFNEGQWNRIATYSPIYVHWTDFLVANQKRRPRKSASTKRSLVAPMDMKTIKLDDELLLTELNDLRKTVTTQSPNSSKEKTLFDDSKYSDEDYGRRTTSPTDEYQTSSDFFHQTREPSLPDANYTQTSSAEPQSITKVAPLQPQITRLQPMKALLNFDFGPEPQASLGVQLRQSTIIREHARLPISDRRSTSPISMSSSKHGTATSALSNRRFHHQYQLIQSQTPSTLTTNALGSFQERLTSESSSSVKKNSYPSSTNTSRSTMHMLKTRTDRARQKQYVALKTILVKPCRQPISSDGASEETIPNSIEMMRKLGGPITAFESNLRYNYNRQLNQFRNGSINC